MKHTPREYQRVYLTFYLRVFEGEEFVGFLIDISREGLMVMSENPLQEGRFYKLKMKLPSTTDWKDAKTRDRVIEFTAQCRWTKHDDVDKDFYLSGFEFTELHEDDNRLIRMLIEEFRLQ